MVETLKDALDAANKTDKLENNFSDADLKIFTGLIADADTYKMLTDGFDDQTTIDDIKTIT